MEVIRDPKPERFLAAVNLLLASAEARNNLLLGLAETLVSRPGVYEEYRLWAVEEGGTIVGAALITPPNLLVVADGPDAVAEAIAAAVYEDLGSVPGVIANRPIVDAFVAAWQQHTGVDAEVLMDQGVFELDQVESVPVPGGGSRPVTPADLDLLVDWSVAFSAEVFPEEAISVDDAREILGYRVAGNPMHTIWLWEVDGQAVSMSGHGNPTPNGVRIGPVYTPPEHRGNGYASALVAAQAQWLLDQGRRFCFLYTDLANPTSNAIYERIGYRRVAEAVRYRFS